MPISTRQLSKIAGISEQSVRNYSREYGALLSPQARGETGPRLFDEQDVQVFCSIAGLRREGVPPAEVLERLRRGDVYIEATPKTPQATPSHADEPQTPLVALEQRLLVLSTMQARLDALERTQRLLLRAAVLWGALWGAVAALAFGAFVLWAIYLLSS